LSYESKVNMSNLLGTTIGRYQLQNLLGRGGMAEVYKAHHLKLDRDVAVKVMLGHIAERPDLITWFEHEAMTVARLRHPNIVQVYDFDIASDMRYLVMEFIAGKALNEELQKRKKEGQLLTLAEVVRIFDALTAAVAYAHSRGVIHRDLKPANVMFTAEGQVVLTDFGVAYLSTSTTLATPGLIVGTPSYMSPEQGRGAAVDPRSDIYTLGIILFELVTGQLPFTAANPYGIIQQHLIAPFPSPTKLNPALPSAIEEIILKATQKDPVQRYDSALELSKDLNQALGTTTEEIKVKTALSSFQTKATVVFSNEAATDAQATIALPSCPYRGLFAFQEADAAFFFGRDEVIDRLAQAIERRSFIALTGPSGSGKSSVALAGLIPHLRQAENLRQKQGTAWFIANLRPGANPFHSLAAALLPLLEPNLNAADHTVAVHRLTAELTVGKTNLTNLVKQILQTKPGFGRLLLVIDQFEELHTLCKDVDVRQRFINLLLDATASTQGQLSPLTLLATLRADFLGLMMTHRTLATALREAMLLLGPMTREELAQAIEGPAQKLGVAFEPGLIARILDDVGEEPGNLPLLEFALTLLWEQQEKNLLTHQAYEVLGRVEGSLARYADDVYDQLNESEQEQARKVFIQLVQPGQGTEDTRRVAKREELGEADWALAQKLAQTRLVVVDLDATGEETVDVVHEALLRSWWPLREWMNADRAFRAWQERLRLELNQWVITDRDTGTLLRGAPLAEAQNWLAQREPQLSQAECFFIEEGVAQQERELAEKEAQQRRELAQAQALAEAETCRAEAQTKFAKDMHRRAWYISGALVLVVIAAFVAFMQRNTALAQERLADSRRLVAQSNFFNQGPLDLALLLSLEANRVEDTLETRGGLLKALNASPNLRTYLRLPAQMYTLAASPDGKTLATGGCGAFKGQQIYRNCTEGMIFLWDLATQQLRGSPFKGHEKVILSLAFSPNGKLLASGSEDQTINIWDVKSGKVLQTLKEHKGPVQTLAFSPDGKTLASGSVDQTLILWDVKTGKMLDSPLTEHTDTIWSIAFSPDGKLLASGSRDKTLIFWDVAKRKPLGKPLPQAGFLRSVTFSPDGKYLAVGGEDTNVTLWDVAKQQIVGQPLVGHTSTVYDLAFSPDSKLLISASADKTLLLWDVETLKRVAPPFTGHNQQVFNVVFNADNQTIASIADDNSLILWDIGAQQRLGKTLEGHKALVNSVTFSPAGNLLASASDDQTLILWDTVKQQQVGKPLKGGHGYLASVAFSPDGKLLAVGNEDATITFWDVATQKLIGKPLKGHTAAVFSVAFSPDGQTLASGSFDQTIRFWEVATQKPLGSALKGHTDEVYSVAFSPDGQILVSGSADNTVRLWDVTTRQEIGSPLEGHSDKVYAVAFSPDGQTLASGGADTQIILWKRASLQMQNLPLRGHMDTVTSLSFSPDGQTLASGSNDKTLLLWDVSTQQMIGGAIRGHTDAISSVAYHPDGKIIASGGADQTVILWDVDLEAWKQAACKLANRNLTAAEWNQYLAKEPYLPTCATLPK